MEQPITVQNTDSSNEPMQANADINLSPGSGGGPPSFNTTDTTVSDIPALISADTQTQKNWLPKAQRKKILLLSDDFRLASGVGVISRELVIGTCHRYNWVQVGAALSHPEAGRGVDVSDSIAKEFGIRDPYVRIFPYNGYGDSNILRFLMETEKPDAILHFTDPRFWGWLYSMEHEIRSKIPLMYIHVWDCTPYPRYNRDFYRSCDAIFTISKQTHNIVRQVLGEENVVDITVETVREADQIN